MTIGQLYDINHCGKESFFDNSSLFSLKNFSLKTFSFKHRWTQSAAKIEAYFNKHHLVCWTAAFLGIPISILSAIWILTSMFGLIILWVMSLI